MFSHILIAYDGSAQSEKAFDQALDLAAKYQAKLSGLAVARPPDFGSDVETEAMLEGIQEQLREKFARLQQNAEKQGVDLTFEVLIGHPAEQIVRQAEQQGIDLIVVGHRGHGLFERWLLGSVARLVIAYAPCAVMVVR